MDLHPDPAPPPQPSILRQIWRRDKIALGLIFLVMLMDVIGMTILFPIAAYIVRQYSDQALMITLLNVIYSAAQFFAAPVIGKISDRVGRRPVLLICLAGAGAGYLMFGFAGALWVLFLSRMIAGITGGSISTASAYIVDVSKPEERANAFTLVGMAWGIGLVLGPALGGALGQFDLRAPAFFSAALALGSMALGFFYLPESLPIERRETKPMQAGDFNTFQSIGAVGRLPGLAVILIGSALFNFAFNGYEQHRNLVSDPEVLHSALADRVDDHAGRDLHLRGAGAAGAADGDAGGGDRRGRFLPAGSGGGSAGDVLQPRVWADLPIAILRSAASGFIFPTLGTLSSKRVSHHEQGVLMGVTTSINGLMGIISPILAGLLYDHVLPGAPYWMAALFFAGAALLLRTQQEAGPKVAPAVS